MATGHNNNSGSMDGSSSSAATVRFYDHMLRVGREHEARGNDRETLEYYEGQLRYLRESRLPMML